MGILTDNTKPIVNELVRSMQGWARAQEPLMNAGGRANMERTGTGLRPGRRHATALRNLLQQLQDDMR
eukprot:11608910-Alexandrium_andersonii.AAC.1